MGFFDRIPTHFEFFFMDVFYVINNGVNWLQEENRCMIKFIQSPKQKNLDFINLNVLY